MDSLTQIVLGAGVGELVLGRKIGNKAMLFGAIAGTLPDLDILGNIWLTDDISEIKLHRGYSHALFTHILLAFPLAWLTFKGFKKKQSYKSWYTLWFLGLSTHALLDSFTTYGTRLFLPFSGTPIGFNNISVIDPLYTLPFMGMLMVCLFIKRENPKRLLWAKRAFYVSCTYMALTFGVKGFVHYQFAQNLKTQHYQVNKINTSPSIFNNILWAGMGFTDSSILVGEYSIFQGDRHIDFVEYPRHLELEKGFEGEALNTLKWFSQGSYILEKKDDETIRFYAIKFGRGNFMETEPEKAFVFFYELKKHPKEVQLKTIRPSFTKEEFKMALSQLWHRLWEKPVE